MGPFTYSVIKEIEDFTSVHTLESYPTVLAIVDEAVNLLGPEATTIEKNAERLRLTNYCFEKINTARYYFVTHFLKTNMNAQPTPGDNDFGHLFVMFQAFALTDPDHFRKLAISYTGNLEGLSNNIRNSLQVLVNMNRICNDLFIGLMGSIGPYLAIAQLFSYGLDAKFSIKLTSFMSFWREHQCTLKHWFQLAKIAILHHPNSAGSERLFSILKSVLKSEKEGCLDDYICSAVYGIYGVNQDDGTFDELL